MVNKFSRKELERLNCCEEEIYLVMKYQKLLPMPSEDFEMNARTLHEYLGVGKKITIYNVIDYCSQTQAVYDHLWNCSYPINELLHSFLDLFTGVKKYVVYY